MSLALSNPMLSNCEDNINKTDEIVDNPCKKMRTEDMGNSQYQSSLDDGYFKSYEDISIHEEMLRDTIRTNAYRSAILKSYKDLYGKVVLDVGAGTGILSMFCVQAGAKKVYAVEASGMALQARKVIASNQMEDKIQVIHAKIEDVELQEKVDVLVSEWMGYFLLYESMLNSVIIARDRWLKTDGIILPSRASLYMAPITDPYYDENLEIWDDMFTRYKVDLSALKPYAKQCQTCRVHVQDVFPQEVQALASELLLVDLKKIQAKDLIKIDGDFDYKCFGHSRIHGFAVWFTTDFLDHGSLSTSPYTPTTHWQQSVMYLDQALSVEQDTRIQGRIKITPHEKIHRFLCVHLKYHVNEADPTEKSYIMDDIII